MEKKHMALLLSLLIALGGLVFIPWGQAQEGEEEERGLPLRPIRRCRLRLLLFLLTRGEVTTLEGQLLLVEGRILVLEVDGEAIYVVLPHRWLIDEEVMTIEELFDGDPLGPGDNLTIHTLMLSHSGENHTVEFYAAYLIEGEEIEAKALTPFNIREG